MSLQITRRDGEAFYIGDDILIGVCHVDDRKINYFIVIGGYKLNFSREQADTIYIGSEIIVNMKRRYGDLSRQIAFNISAPPNIRIARYERAKEYGIKK